MPDQASSRPDTYSVITVSKPALERCFGTPGTVRGRRVQMAKLIVLTFLPGLMLIVQNGIYLQTRSAFVDDGVSVKEHVLLSLEIGNVIHRTQIERGTSALYLASGGDNRVRDRLLEAYVETDRAIRGIHRWVVQDEPPHFASKEKYHARIKDFRARFNAQSHTLHELIEFYSVDNSHLIGVVAEVTQEAGSAGVWTSLVAYHLLITSKEYAGIERALGSTFFARGYFTGSDLNWYLKQKSLGSSYLSQSIRYSTLVETLVTKLFLTTQLAERIDSMRVRISDNNSGNQSSVIYGTLWFDNMTDFINILHTVEGELATDIVTIVDATISTYRRDVIVNAFEMSIVLLLVPFVVFLVVKATRQIQVYAEGLQIKSDELDQERKRSETLLFQMIPKSIAMKLLDKEEIIPEVYHSISVLFSDVVGFTQISARSTPIQVMDMLNHLYLRIDMTLEKFDVYKVETIGDALMVVSGLPHRNGDRHASEIANFAMAMLDTIAKMDVPHLQGETLRVRLGINTGAAVAGIVGTKMPRFCVLGDTVNIASRMESTGKPSGIQISDFTRRKLDSIGGYVIRERGEINIKGKGSMKTFWLIGREQETMGSCHMSYSPCSSLPSIKGHVTPTKVQPF